MPEEYRVWKEQIEAVEKKKHGATAAAAVAAATALALSVASKEFHVSSDAGGGGDAASQSLLLHGSGMGMGDAGQGGGGVGMGDDSSLHTAANAVAKHVPRAASKAAKAAASGDFDQNVMVPTFATKAEAEAAFKQLLDEKNVTATMRLKDAAELCQGDGRWGCIPSAGGKKQALAEFQVSFFNYNQFFSNNAKVLSFFLLLPIPSPLLTTIS